MGVLSALCFTGTFNGKQVKDMHRALAAVDLDLSL